MTDLLPATNPEEILRNASAKLAQIVPKALNTVHELLDAPDDKVRLAAAKDILDRAGLSARVKVEGEFTVTMDDEIERLLERLTRPAPIIDIDALVEEEVDEDDVDEAPTRNTQPQLIAPNVNADAR